MANNYRWQVPGNGNPFDTTLDQWETGKMSQRSIGVLKYIHDHQKVLKTDFEKNIKKYLHDTYNHVSNLSLSTHFYRPLEFIGLILNYNNELSLSIDGSLFLKEVENKNYSKALDYYILQMLKTKYPNTATRMTNLNLFPFRIIFKLLLEYNHLPLQDFTNVIPYIVSNDDIREYKSLIPNKKNYEKWKSWVLSYLIKWKILDIDNNRIFLTDYKKEFIASLLENITYDDMFFTEEEAFNKTYHTKRKNRSRNSRLIKQVLNKYNNTCFFDKNHITFKTKTADNYVECHHIIPLSLSESFDKNLDCEDNLIPLCPNCHRAIHLSIIEHKDIMIDKIYNNSDLKNTFTDLSYNNLVEIYLLH